MTLIVSPGEDVLSSSSDDGDSGCLAGSPDLKEESSIVKHCLSLQDVKTLQVSMREGVGQEGDPTPTESTHSLDADKDSLLNTKNLLNGEKKQSRNSIESDSDKKEIREKNHDGLGTKSAISKTSISFGSDIISECKVKEDRQNTEIPERRLEGPAVISSPVVHLASQVHCHESVKFNEHDFPPSNQKSVLAVQLTSCNSNSCNDSSSGLVSDDVTETLISAHPSSSGKWGENRDVVGGYSEGVGGALEGEGVVCDTSTNAGVTINGNDKENGDERNKKNKDNLLGSPNMINKKHCQEKDATCFSIVGKDTVEIKSSYGQEVVSVDGPKNHISDKEEKTQDGIHRAKEKINLLRQNFLSSLSADDDFEQPDFIILPHHSDHPEDEEWLGDGDSEQAKCKVENNEYLDTERKDKCNSEVTEVIAGSECGSHLTNGGDFLQEAGEEEEENEERVKNDDKEEQERGENEALVVPGAGGSSAECGVKQKTLDAAFYGTEHLEKDQYRTFAQDNITSLEYIPRENILSAKEKENDQVSCVNALVMEASARLLEHEISGRDEPTDILVSDDTTLRGSGSNVICEGAITPEAVVMGESDCDIADSSLLVKLQSTPPAELPPSLPPSPPPPPSSPQSPCLFSRDGSGSPTNYLKAQSASFVNLLMLQSRKHKRLHRLRLPDTSPTVADAKSPEEGEDEGNGLGEFGNGIGNDNEECKRRLQTLQSPSAQPPQQLGNVHVRPSSPSSPSVAAAANTHCGTTDQLVLFHPGPPPLCLPSPPPPPLHGIHPHSSSDYVVGLSHHPRQARPLPLAVDTDGDYHARESPRQVPVRIANDNQRKDVKSTSILRKLEDENKINEHLKDAKNDSGVIAIENDNAYEVESQCNKISKKYFNDTRSESKIAVTIENDSAYENESHCSDNSCLGYLNFDHESFVDSDNEYDIEQKNKLREACKDIARALNTLPSPLPEDEDGAMIPQVVCRSEVMYHDTRPQYRDQQVEAHLSDTDDPLTVDRLSVQVRSCGTSTTSDEDRRNSFYDNCSINEGHCDCGRCDTSDVEIEPKSHFPPPPPGSPPPIPPPPSQRAMDRWKRPQCQDRKVKKLPSGGVSKRGQFETDDGFKTDSRDGCRTDEFDACTTSDDNDYDDDYCQTDDCGEDCDYCSGDDDEDEAEDTCYFCKQSQNVAPVCKHPGVITNGVLKSFNGRGHGDKECTTRGVPHGRSLALQAAIHRRHLTRQGLVAIRESSITSDELPESEEEHSFDGSNCDISSSWRFGLCRDLTGMSRDSTLRSVRSERSSSSLPVDHVRRRNKEKSNSLPGANSRSIVGSLPRRRASGVGSPFHQVSTSDDESGSHSSLPRLPPRPPRAPRMRPPLTPSPPAGGSLITPASPSSPRPAMGLQGLQQQRSPGTPRALHVSGLPVAPRTVAPRSPSNPNPPYGFPSMVASGPALLCPGSPGLAGRSTPSPGGGSEGPPASPRINSRAGALVTRNFSISDDESGGRWSSGRRHVTITRHESVYKEVAEKGYHLPPGSPVDPYWLTWKLGVLQKTVEEVSGRLDEAQRTADGWGPLSQDPNLADQHAHNVRKFREGLAELQRGVDDVNDQAARFSAHNVPLTPANSAKLHDLNNRWKNLETAVNDRWRQVASRSREVTPLTPAQLASSVSPPWERATTSNKVPYYINHDQESTHWDHPIMMDLLDSMNEFNHIKFSAYRTATKLRILQKKLSLDLAKLQMATDVFDEHGLRGQNDRLIDVGDMIVVLSALYANISADHPEVNTTLAIDLCLNWLLNVYDSQRTGQMRVLSFKIGLVCLCCGHLEEKYRYMFRLIADPNRLVDQRKLGLLLHDCVQVPRQLGEVAAFGGSNIEPSVRSCFTKAGKDRETIEAVHFLAWVQQEPQSLVWLAVLHRVAASENIQHQVKCNICKAYPIVGLRYRCLKCLSFDMCQRCFFDGRSGKSHKITHPMHEYCTATTAGEDVKDFTKALKNKFKSKRSLQKHTKKGYLPVQTVLEGDPLESPSPSPQHNVTSQDMHSRLELYASRLAEVELRTNSNSTPDSEDEHGLIAQYCQSLSSSDAPLPVPRSPLQIMAAVDADQKDELEQMIRALEEENSVLQAEYDRLKSQQTVGSPPDDGLAGQRSEADMLAEAKLLRQHKGRLEARMGILEEHNRQLEAQLHRLRQLLGEPGVSSPNKSGTLQTKSVTASQLAMDSPAKLNGHSTQGGATSAYEGLEQMSEYVRPPPPPMGSVAHVGNLFSRAAPYRSSGWRLGEGSWHSGGHNDPRGGERLA
ncbi:LOW QUALITY PROTEIN: uncharacterized protein [Palaemon carinicauda]|uniref:LOW QUALITY PROTEIN: uncharacterized protein n=1 Tax=Palaemon carinicauda TaxID=392227 RepID=UPI0035B5B14B